MFILDLSAGLDFIQSPAAIREPFESINSNEHAVMRQRRFKDRWNSWVGDQRSGAPDGLGLVVFGVDENAARPQQPRLDADLDPHALDCAGERFLCWFRIINGLPEPLRALTMRRSLYPPSSSVCK